MRKNVSIIVPSIRPKNLPKFYEYAIKACKHYTFELVVPGPYIIPEELMKKGNVKFIHTYANPTIAFQMAALLCDADYIYNTTDDGLIQPNAIDTAIELFDKLNFNDCINMRYNEAVLDVETLEPFSSEKQIQNLNGHKDNPAAYWYAWTHGDLRLPGIQRQWKTAPHFFMKLDYFYSMGGFDCDFEYCNHPLHDLAFRLQAAGGNIIDLPFTAFYCSHLPGVIGDHKPVNDAQSGPDQQKFNIIYSNPNAAFERIHMNYNSWKNQDNIWTRRFDQNNLQVKL